MLASGGGGLWRTFLVILNKSPLEAIIKSNVLEGILLSESLKRLKPQLMPYLGCARFMAERIPEAGY